MLKKLASRMPGYSELIGVVDSVSTSSIDALQLAGWLYPQLGSGLKVLDLGCGEGISATGFRNIDRTVDWHGVDIESSPEVNARSKFDEQFKSFDGINIPYEDNAFDMVYCQQVLEHVSYPHELFSEVLRVLKPEGYFVGSVSYLEPYHSYSKFNFTPYGMNWLMTETGLQPTLLKHCTGLHYKVFRQILGGFSFYSIFSRFSVWNALLDGIGFVFRSSKRDINLLKLQYSSTFAFAAMKAGPAGPV